MTMEKEICNEKTTKVRAILDAMDNLKLSMRGLMIFRNTITGTNDEDPRGDDKAAGRNEISLSQLLSDAPSAINDTAKTIDKLTSELRDHLI